MPCWLRAVGFGRSMGMLSMVSKAILKSFRLAPSIASPNGIPYPSVRRLRFVPFFARSVGLGPVFFPTERGLAHRTVHREPLPVNTYQPIKGEEPLLPEFKEDTSFDPLKKAAMCARARAQPSAVQRVPLHSRPQHQQDGVHRLTVGFLRIMAPQWMRLAGLRKQRLNQRPEHVRDAPSVVFVHKAHEGLNRPYDQPRRISGRPSDQHN